jgi:hypothetical protein
MDEELIIVDWDELFKTGMISEINKFLEDKGYMLIPRVYEDKEHKPVCINVYPTKIPNKEVPNNEK